MTGIYVSPHFGNYGAEKSLIALMKGIRKYGITPILIIPYEGPICKLLQENQIQYYVMPYRNWINVGKGTRIIIGIIKYFINEYFAFRGRRLFKEKSVLYVHSNSIVTSFGEQLARRLNVKCFQHIREFGDLDFNMSYDLGEKASMKYIHRSASKIICISKAVQCRYSKWFDSSQCCLIYNGVSSNDEGVKNEGKNEIFNIVLVGRLSEEKGQIDLLAAAKILIDQRISNFHIDLYGDGKDKYVLEKYISENNLTNFITFKGYQSDVNLTEYDVGIVASKNEAFGRVTVEYMLAKLPVVGVNSGGTKEIICDGETGYLYEAGDVLALADNIKKIFNDPVLAHKLGETGYYRARSMFSEKKYIENILKVYKLENVF